VGRFRAKESAYSWTEKELTLLVKNNKKSIKDLVGLFPKRSKNAIMAQRYRIRKNEITLTTGNTFYCPHCDKRVENGILFSHAGRVGGRTSTPKKTRAVRENGKLGGRPPRILKMLKNIQKSA
jgi:hypothetical protein